MKRSVLIMLSSVLILLTACRAEPQELRNTFEADVTVSGGVTDYTAHISRSPGEVTVALTSPASVAGLGYTYSGGELTTSYGELSCVTSGVSLPLSSAPAVLCEALSRIGEAAYESSSDGADTYRLSLSAGSAVMTCADGLPVKITADFSPYTVTFTADDGDD